MPKLKNPRHEAYARLRASGLLPSKAAPAAGYAPGSAIYVQLDRTPQVVARIEELSTERGRARSLRSAELRRSVENEVIDQTWVLRELARTVADASEDGKFRDATQALKLLSSALGMHTQEGRRKMMSPTQRSEISPDRFETLRPLFALLERLEATGSPSST